EEVLETQRIDWLRGEIDHPRLRVTQTDQQEQQPLLVEAGRLELEQLRLVERERRNDDRGIGLFLTRRERSPERVEARLQSLELRDFLLGREVGRGGGLHGHARILALPTPWGWCVRIIVDSRP